MTADSPEGWRPGPSSDEVREVLDRIETEASAHGANYAAGMREARRIVEAELQF